MSIALMHGMFAKVFFTALHSKQKNSKPAEATPKATTIQAGEPIWKQKARPKNSLT
jgi:hypothetical protein